MFFQMQMIEIKKMIGKPMVTHGAVMEQKSMKVRVWKLKKTSFRISNNKEVNDKFQKHVFRFTDGYNGKTVLVYMGDSEAYQNLSHGNRKRNNRPHKRSKPSLNLRQM